MEVCLYYSYEADRLPLCVLEWNTFYLCITDGTFNALEIGEKHFTWCETYHTYVMLSSESGNCTSRGIRTDVIVNVYQTFRL